MEAQNKESKKKKGWKITSYVINILSIIIMLFAIFIVITSLVSKDKGYTSYFNKAYVAVKSNSMAKNLSEWDNFQKGDVISFRVLSEKEKVGLTEGTVITFWDYNISSTKELNTHRIYATRDSDGDGIDDEYSTKGDNMPTYDRDSEGNQIWRKASDVQGVYAGKSVFFGRILTYLQSKTGFAIFIVVPCVLIVIYCLTLVVLNLMKYTKAKAVMQHEDNVDALKAELKAQLLKEMQEENKSNNKEKSEEKDKETETKNKAEKDEKENVGDNKTSKKQTEQKSEE